jgi:hypothetical protein
VYLGEINVQKMFFSLLIFMSISINNSNNIYFPGKILLPIYTYVNVTLLELKAAIQLNFLRAGLSLFFMTASWSQVCQIFLYTTYQNGKNIPDDHQIYRPQIIPNGRKIDQMAVR